VKSILIAAWIVLIWTGEFDPGYIVIDQAEDPVVVVEMGMILIKEEELWILTRK
jgi:hypothetical protein